MLPRTGSYRTDIALRTIAQCDFEATGQAPKRQRLPSVFVASFVDMLSAKPVPRHRQRVKRVVEVQQSRCGLCQHPMVKAAAVLAMLVFIFSVVAPAWHEQPYVQDHFTHHGGGHE